MKTLLFFCLLILLAAFTAGTAGPVQPLLQLQPDSIHITWQLIVAIIAGTYEVIVRSIPTVANYSIIAKIIEGLKWVSDFFNRKKK